MYGLIRWDALPPRPPALSAAKGHDLSGQQNAMLYRFPMETHTASFRWGGLFFVPEPLIASLERRDHDE